MQTTLDVFSLRAFTKALTCLSKYGDELSIYATPDYLSFSATNSSKSAFCLFKYERQFFSRYRLGTARIGMENDPEEDLSVTGQLTVKSFLSILRHRTVEKSVERCELAIVEGDQAPSSEDDDEDTLESRLIVRFYCKHGVIKTHRLVLLTPGSIMTPGAPDPTNESRLIIGPKALKDLLDHFPVAKGTRSDPQLVWAFEESEVVLKSMESPIDSRGKGQLSTEISISSEEFDVYDVAKTPTTLAFHLREFNATISFADSVSLSLEMRFTEPATPLFIEIEGDALDVLFVISTSQVQGAPGLTQQNETSQAPNARKREHEQLNETMRIKKPMKAAQAITLNHKSSGESRAGSYAFGFMPRPSAIPQHQLSHGQDASQDSHNQIATVFHCVGSQVYVPQQIKEEPLFLPSSQLSVADEEALKAIGLDLEAVDAEQLADLLEGDGEEVDFSYMSQPSAPIERVYNLQVDNNRMDMNDHEGLQLTATQQAERAEKTFQPLFED